MKDKIISIGIITYWWSKENYGQILQMYALQEYLKNLGYNVFLIKYDASKDASLFKKRNWYYYFLKLLNPKAINRKLKQRSVNIKRDEERITHPRFFNEFLKSNIKESDKIYNSIENLRKDPPIADVYITGSDVVWSHFRPAYFLDFGSPEIKRISYAASFGRETISDEECRQIEPLLKRFNLVTVRESQGLEICLKSGRNDAKLVLDPTLLLTKEQYIQLSKNVNKGKKNCFLYLLGSETNFSMNQIIKATKSKNLDLIYATCERFDKYTKVYPTINEWLGYYMHADIILTNSYHGCIFAIVFNKDFVFLPLKGIHSKLNVRVNSLLSELNLTNRICNNNFLKIFNSQIDYTLVNAKLGLMTEDIDTLLKKELNIK